MRSTKTIKQLFGGMGIFAGHKELLMNTDAGSINKLETKMLNEKFITWLELMEKTGYSRSALCKKLNIYEGAIEEIAFNGKTLFKKSDELKKFISVNTKSRKHARIDAELNKELQGA